MKNKQNTHKKVVIEFDEQHLSTLITALEVYSRLQSGQIKMAVDTAYADRLITHQESQYIENVIRSIAFPSLPKREYDGHGGFYDQYNNIYAEDGSISEESKEWKTKKNSPHLDHPNTFFGVGCKEMKDGTVAFEIKKTLEQYLHYQRNNGFRKVMDVTGDGAMQLSNIPVPRILNWKPEKYFKISTKDQKHIESAIEQKNYDKIWDLVHEAFKNKPLPRGKASKIQKTSDGSYHVVIEEPYEL